MSSLCVALVIAHTGFQPVEYHDTKKELEKSGISVVTVSNKPGVATATDNSTVPVDVTLEDFDITSCAGFFVIGGGGALENLNTPLVHKKLFQASRADRAYGAICISPRIILQTGLFEHKNFTGWNGDNALQALAKRYKAIYVDKPVVQDGRIITASGPAAAHEFGKTIAHYLVHSKQ